MGGAGVSLRVMGSTEGHEQGGTGVSLGACKDMGQNWGVSWWTGTWMDND